MRKALTLPALAVLVCMAVPAFADNHKNRLNIPHDQWLSVSEVIQKLSAQGYKVTEIESDDGAYEFEATNAQGVRVEGHAHPVTGQVMPGYDD
jgi:hypothetical protein